MRKINKMNQQREGERERENAVGGLLPRLLAPMSAGEEIS